MKISVITVCFNSASHIVDALHSVDAQTWPDIEHLVIDGGSLDDTLRIVQQHARAWRRVISEPDGGIYDAMNKGIRLATGDVIGFLNADDFYTSPESLTKIADAFVEPSLDTCYGDLCYVEPDRPSSVVRYWRSTPFMPGLFLRGWCPPHPTFYVRRRVFELCGVFDESYRIASDVEFMMRVLEVHRVRVRYLPELLVKMRTGGVTNRSWRNIVRQNREIWQALERHGLRPSLGAFIGGKLWSRGKQFMIRPT